MIYAIDWFPKVKTHHLKINSSYGVTLWEMEHVCMQPVYQACTTYPFFCCPFSERLVGALQCNLRQRLKYMLVRKIPHHRYDGLFRQRSKGCCVDSWNGYGSAICILYQQKIITATQRPKYITDATLWTALTAARVAYSMSTGTGIRPAL